MATVTFDVLRAGRRPEDLTRGNGYVFAPILPKIVCDDGFTLSVQASAHHYCSPRDDFGPWATVEVGFPSERPEPWDEWARYCESPERPTDTVYGYVPFSFVEALITSHGGTP